MVSFIFSILLLNSAYADPEPTDQNLQESNSLQRYFEEPSLENLRNLTAPEVRSVVSSGIYEYMLKTECPQCLEAKAFGDTNTVSKLDAAYPLLDDDGKRQILMDYFRMLTLRQKILRSDAALQDWLPLETSRLLDLLLTSRGLFGEGLQYGIDEFEPFFCSQSWFNPHTTDAVALRKTIEDHNLGATILNLRCRREDGGSDYAFKDYLNELVRKQKSPKPPNQAGGPSSKAHAAAITGNSRRGDSGPCKEQVIAKEIRYFVNLISEPGHTKNQLPAEIWFDIKDGTCSIMGALSRTRNKGFKFRIIPHQMGGIRGVLFASGEDELVRMLTMTFAD